MNTSTQCLNCANLTLDHLVDLAKNGIPRYHNVPRAACYQLHDSIEGLEVAAASGCHFCHFLVACLKGYVDNYQDIADEWEGEDCDPEISLLTAARKLRNSEVRVCVLSDDPTRDSTLDDMRVIDTILVEIGPHEKGALDDGNDTQEREISELPDIVLTLASPRANAVTFGHLRIGRYEVDRNIDAQSNTDIAKGWLHTCQTSHLGCMGTSIPELPTRVIDVGIQHDWGDLHITHTRQERAAYIALSHCWGGPITTMLTSKTIHKFQRRLPFLELPANFRDAITITRRLGFRYLWIDSLCIIQDSREDWAEESRKMGFTYRNSTLTISAMASQGSKHGIIPRDVPMRPSPPPTIIRVSSSSEEAVTVLRQDFREETLRKLDVSGPLSSRGWSLQESVLSPRHLYYGTNQLYWRCPEGYQAADGTSSGLRIPEYPIPHMSSVLHGDASKLNELPARELLLQDYYTLVETYSHRSLTFGSDKLPAFSGISSRLHPFVGGTYLAGLWTTDLPVGLLWRSEMRTCKHTKLYRAPSWSWAVTDEEVLYYEKEGLSESSMVIQLVNHSILLRDEANPYGEIQSASITVKGLTIPLVRTRQHIPGHPEEYYIGHAYLDNDPPRYEDDDPNIPTLVERTRPSLFLAADSDYLLAITYTVSPIISGVEVNGSLYTAEEYLALVVHVDEREGDSVGTVRCVRGLVVQPIRGRGEDDRVAYERVGMFEIKSLWLSRLQAWESRTLVLV